MLNEKFKWACQLLRDATEENRGVHVQLDDLLLECDRLNLQLEQKKTQLALVEEKKAENELNMKKEIKALLEAYLQLKAKLDEQQMENEEVENQTVQMK